MRLALGLVMALALAAPASAADPGPTILDFEDQPLQTNIDDVYAERRGEVVFRDGESCGFVADAGEERGRFLATSCEPIRLTFTEPQAVVSVYTIWGGIDRRAGSTSGTIEPFVFVTAYDAEGQRIAESSVDSDPGEWAPATVRAPGDARRIVRVEFSTLGSSIGVDEIGFSPFPQPNTEITAGPSGTTASREAAFAFTAGQDEVSYACSLDGAAPEPCTGTKSYSALAVGAHTFTVAATDRWGETDATPATRTWTIADPPPPPADRDADAVIDTADNCPENANAGQEDGDQDEVGDACEALPSGTAPIEAGRASKVRLVSGEVFVKLPTGASRSAFTTSLRAPFQDGGFVPLKGTATVPMGSTLDTRLGEVALTAAVNGQRPRSQKQLRSEARFRAGIFAIRQSRRSRKRARKRTIPARAELVSAPGAQAPCARTAPGGGPLKGVRVRSLSVTAKGVFRAVGGAATASPAKGTATFVTTDRCDGTVTEVGRGRVAVISKRTGKRRVVRPGQAYLVRARLFAARKGRPRTASRPPATA